MSDLDDLMSHLSAYDDPDQTAPADAIAANQAAKMSGKFLSWGKRGPTKEEREAKSPQLSRVVETVVGKEKTNMNTNTNNTKDETVPVEKAHQTVAVSEVREKSASPVKARVATVAAVRATEAKKVEVSKTTSAKAKQPPPPPLGPSEKASADGFIMGLLLNDLTMDEGGKPITLGRVRASAPDSSSAARVDAATMEDVMMEQHMIPNLNYRRDGVPLEFQDELPEVLPLPIRKEKGGMRGRGGKVSPPTSRSSSKSISRSTVKSSSSRSPVRSTMKTPSRTKPATATRRRVVSPVSVNVPTEYKEAFQTEYLNFLGRMREAARFAADEEEKSLEEIRMGGAIAECMREMLSDGEIMDTIMKGAFKRIERQSVSRR